MTRAEKYKVNQIQVSMHLYKEASRVWTSEPSVVTF
jgi:hypothetical protein